MIKINKLTGTLVINDIKITRKTLINDLTDFFSIGEEQNVKVVNNTVKCIFAEAKVVEKNIETIISLRFDNNNLVSIFIDVNDLNKDYKNADAFYSSENERVQLARNWLKTNFRMNCIKGKSYLWGHVGIGVDKSSNVFIFIHNKNNTWIFGE